VTAFASATAFGVKGLEVVLRQELERDRVRPGHHGGLVAAERLVLLAPQRAIELLGGGQVAHRQVHEDHLGHFETPTICRGGTYS
jgi:hypothetical protein